MSAFRALRDRQSGTVGTGQHVASGRHGENGRRLTFGHNDRSHRACLIRVENGSHPHTSNGNVIESGHMALSENGSQRRSRTRKGQDLNVTLASKRGTVARFVGRQTFDGQRQSVRGQASKQTSRSRGGYPPAWPVRIAIPPSHGQNSVVQVNSATLTRSDRTGTSQQAASGYLSRRQKGIRLSRPFLGARWRE
jgi:hypothetical protein